ncbi:enoyl-CoA hydratase/isomerase family protein [Pseudonocardia ailaonensis]|uniref:Enoyl-CoA hydratase/isomerase family protein n=1 Tax=Pseudonocardia ailaonensis TaxID=367279 RepID=A0ABN2N7E8_9PSEU
MADFEVRVTTGADHVGVVEFERGRHNFFHQPLIAALADAIEELAQDDRARAVVLCSTGRHFCAGADFGGDEDVIETINAGRHLYDEAFRLFAQPLPVVAAVQGSAIGGGLGLALAADFRVSGPGSRWAAPFSRLGLHQGFGISVTLPRAVGEQAAADLLLTGRRIDGTEAHAIGLVDRLVPDDELREAAHAHAAQLASAAPLAVRSIRATLRGDLAARVQAATNHEKAEQLRLSRTEDHREGIAADLARREPSFAAR